MIPNDPKIVVVGGGTGSFTLLSGLKEYTANITALVNMSDDGGSTGVLRDELGVLPPGDIRQCLVALSDSPELRELFSYRFDSGSMDGHSFGNIFISAVEKMTGDFEKAVNLASKVLNIQGSVLPVTLKKSKLVVEFDDGEAVRDQCRVANMSFNGKQVARIYLEPDAELTESGKQAIYDADLVIIAPGNLYGSLAPVLVVNGLRQVLEQTNAKIAYVCNLVTKPNQTDGFTVCDYAREVERFIGLELLDFVIYNTAKPPEKLAKRYLRDNEKIVGYSQAELDKQHYKSIGIPLIASSPIVYSKADKIANARSLIRHDTDALASQLFSLTGIAE